MLLLTIHQKRGEFRSTVYDTVDAQFTHGEQSVRYSRNPFVSWASPPQKAKTSNPKQSKPQDVKVSKAHHVLPVSSLLPVGFPELFVLFLGETCRQCEAAAGKARAQSVPISQSGARALTRARSHTQRKDRLHPPDTGHSLFTL